MAPGDAPTQVSDAHALTVAGVATRLGVDPARGLEDAEAANRAALVGPNALERGEAPSMLRMVLDAATEPFVLLLVASGIGAILLGEVRDGFLILVGLIPIVGADVLTEYRGERALEALREASAPVASVRRGGRVLDVPAATIVPGDVVLIRMGDVVPADLKVVHSDRLAIDRSALTGESLPEPVALGPDPAGTALADRRSMAFSGTSVVGGRGEGIVVAIGPATEMGRIAGSLAARSRRRSPLQRELDRLVRILIVVAVGLIGVTSGLGFVRGNPIGENLLAGISAAIAAIPEEPPILLAVVLGLGAVRLLKRGVLVRRLNAEEVLGAVDLVVTDKTGTLTMNRLEIASLTGVAGPIDDVAARLDLLTDALRAEDDAWSLEPGVGTSSFTQALVRAVEAGGGASSLDADALVSSEPATDGRPYTSTTARRGDVTERLVIGAPEAVAAVAGAAPDELDAWQAALSAAGARGERVVGVAGRIDGRAWTLRGLVGFADALRPGIRAAMADALGAGMQVVMVTGDHPATAASIAGQAGLDEGGVALGSEVDTWSDDELARRLPGIRAIARSTPDQKRRIVQVARDAGRLVAVTGDGVNDAPALHAADVAVAMGSGTAVAREASDLVLGDDSFVTLVYGMREGRRIVDNAQKGLVFLISTHVALLGFLLIATLAGFSRPLLPIQILWLELFIDLAASVAFEREPPEPDLMTRPPRHMTTPLLTNGLFARISIAGGFSAVAALVLLATDSRGPEHGQWLAYTALVCAQAVRAYANRSLTEPVHRLSANGVLLGAAILTVVVQVAIPYLPALADAFRAQPLNGLDWALVALVALGPAALAQVLRARLRGVWIA